MQNRSESELIAAVLAGEIHLYRELIHPYERRVYMMARAHMKNEEDAKDTAQESFLKAYLNLGSFRGDAKFSTWLISIAINEARTRIRRRNVDPIQPFMQIQVDDGAEYAFDLPDWRELPLQALEREEIGRLIDGAARLLPAIYQQVFFLRDVEERNVNEAARILNINATLVRVRLHRARTMLQKLLAPKLRAVGAVPADAQFQRA